MKRHIVTSRAIQILTLWIPALLFASFEIASSQPTLRIGPMAGLALNHHTFGFLLVDTDASPLFPPRISPGIMAGMSMEYRLDSSWSLSATVAYNDLGGNSSVSETNPNRVFYDVEAPGQTPPPDGVIDHVVRYNYEFSYSSFSLGIAGQWRPLVDSTWTFGIDLGMTFHTILNHVTRQTIDLLEPEDGRFLNIDGRPLSNNSKTLILYDGDIPEANSTRLGLKGGIFTEFGDRDSGTVFSPGLFYEYGLTHVEQFSDWKLNRFGAELRVWFAL